MRLRRAVVRAAAAMALAHVVYQRLLREPVLTWGATPEEVGRTLPGDELLEEADIVATRAITIDAPASAVWPWLVQMGPGRGGAYTYDWIENLLGLDMHSADQILPELQRLEVGDVMGTGTAGDSPVSGDMRVEVLEPERLLSWRALNGKWVWTFALVPQGGGTRLISRNRISMEDASLGQRLAMLAMEPGSLVMERKMLLGIKERAERLASDQAAAQPA
jgi:hypothetical protein